MWSNLVAPNKAKYSTAYVARGGEVITSSCAPGSIDIKPTYASNTAVNGYGIIIDLGGHGTLNFTVTVFAVVTDGAPEYMRWTGNVTGGIVGGEVIHGGVATFQEQNLENAELSYKLM